MRSGLDYVSPFKDVSTKTVVKNPVRYLERNGPLPEGGPWSSQSPGYVLLGGPTRHTEPKHTEMKKKGRSDPQQRSDMFNITAVVGASPLANSLWLPPVIYYLISLFVVSGSPVHTSRIPAADDLLSDSRAADLYSIQRDL